MQLIKEGDYVLENVKLKELPRNINCEIELLSAMFHDHDIIPEIIDELIPEDFYSDYHKVIYKAVCSIFADGSPLNLSYLIEYIGKDNMKNIGGITYLTNLMMNGICISPKQYIATLKEKSFRRNAIRKLNMAIENLYDEKSNPYECVQKAMDSIGENGQSRKTVLSDSTLISYTLEDIEKRINCDDEIPGMKTGLRDFDRTVGGFVKGELVVIAGRPSMGKTTFALNVSDGLGDNGYRTLLCELEMNESAIGMRRLSYSAHVEAEKMKFGKLTCDEKFRILEAGNKISERNTMYTDCTPNQSLLTIRAKSKSIKQSKGLDLIIIDHLSLMDMPQNITRDACIGEVTRGLKCLAKEINVCIILLCQLKRAVEERKDKRPMLSDLRESGNIEQDADMVAFLYRDEYYNKFTKDKGIMECIIGKQRNGRIGTLTFAYDDKFQKISDISRHK